MVISIFANTELAFFYLLKIWYLNKIHLRTMNYVFLRVWSNNWFKFAVLSTQSLIIFHCWDLSCKVVTCSFITIRIIQRSSRHLELQKCSYSLFSQLGWEVPGEGFPLFTWSWGEQWGSWKTGYPICNLLTALKRLLNKNDKRKGPSSWRQFYTQGTR